MIGFGGQQILDKTSEGPSYNAMHRANHGPSADTQKETWTGGLSWGVIANLNDST